MSKYDDSNVPEFIDIPLTRPIEVNGAKVAALRMRQPLVSDHRVAVKSSGTDDEKEMKLFANLCDMSHDDMLKLSMRDYKKVMRAFEDFFESE